MTRCAQSGCVETRLDAYGIFPTGAVTLLCRDCFDALFGLGMDIERTERRSTAIPARVQRRLFRPEWALRNLSKVFSGGSAR